MSIHGSSMPGEEAKAIQITVQDQVGPRPPLPSPPPPSPPHAAAATGKAGNLGGRS